jgi:hypothetical protein
MIDNSDASKPDIKTLLELYCKQGDRWAKHYIFIDLLKAFGCFVEAWDKETHELLEPVLHEYCCGLVDLINGRHSDLFTPAPRKGRRPSSAFDLQPQAHAALYAYLRMQIPGIETDMALKEAARKFGFDQGSVNYWLRQATNGKESPWTAIFELDRRILDDKFPNSPERQAAFLLKAHRQAEKKFRP